jgi:hypothetical protein
MSQSQMYLHRDDLVKLIEFIDNVNPPDTMRLQAGVVRVDCDTSSGIGAIIKATVPHEYRPNEFGDLTIVISGEENW